MIYASQLPPHLLVAAARAAADQRGSKTVFVTGALSNKQRELVRLEWARMHPNQGPSTVRPPASP